MLTWLANHCAARGLGLTKGQIVTTGSCTGMLFAPAGSQVRGTVEAMNVGDTQVQNFGSARDVLIRLPLRDGVKQSELVGRVHRHVEAVLGKARDERLVGRHDEHRHGVVVGDVALLHEQSACSELLK